MQLAPHKYVTYTMARPLRSHWTPASCEDVDCQFYLNGWLTTVDESTALGQAQAAYIRRDRSRSHKEERNELGLTEFTFGPGQECFDSARHIQQAEKEPLYLVKGGGLNMPTRVHRNGSDWAEDFGEHTERLAEAIKRG